MRTIVSQIRINGIPCLNMENDWLAVKIAPSIGGKIVSICNKRLQREFLWTNPGLSLERYSAGTEYDPHFFGGIDELLPNDIPEHVNGIGYPDHGELWTSPLRVMCREDSITLHNVLPLSRLYYEKTLSLEESGPFITCRYVIRNDSDKRLDFLWKLHAAMAIGPGDRIHCPASLGQVVDDSFSRFPGTGVFAWPVIGHTDVSVIAEANDTMDFFYLFGLKKGRISWVSHDKRSQFSYRFDPKVFPFVWYFVSYGGFQGLYTAVLEPCSTMPISVNAAAGQKTCSTLNPEEHIETCVTIYAGGYNSRIK